MSLFLNGPKFLLGLLEFGLFAGFVGGDSLEFVLNFLDGLKTLRLFLTDKIELGLCECDGSLLLVDLRCPGFKRFLLLLDLVGESLSFGFVLVFIECEIGTFKAIANGVEFLFFNRKVGFQFGELSGMFFNLFSMIGDPTRRFREGMFTLPFSY